MNVIFEGISGSGKSTIYNKVCESLDKEKIEYERIGDLEYETPIKPILLDIVKESPLMTSNASFNTTLYESLLLAANHHYTQEKLRRSEKICLYDRDFISLLAYQYVLLKKEYGDIEELFDIYKKLVLFNLKNIDSIFYVDTPIDVCVKRTEIRDHRTLTEDEIKQLAEIKDRFNIELNNYLDKVVILDGEKDVLQNANEVLRLIRRR